MQSPIGALIERKRRETEHQQFNREAAIAYEMAYIIQFKDIVRMMGSGVALVLTEDARKIVDIICSEALDKRQIEANGFAMERNREIVGYKDEIDNLKNEIHSLEQRLKRKDERRNRESPERTKSDVDESERMERHTPIPDHASTSHA